MSNSNQNIDSLKNELWKNRIEITDTISQFMEKCNNNFTIISEWGGGPSGVKGDNGDPGFPTKPKVPIHIWRAGVEYAVERDNMIADEDIYVDLTDVKYQEGHLIILQNAHVYILELQSNTENEFSLKPKFVLALQSYNPGDVVDGKSAYVHIAYADSADGTLGFTHGNNTSTISEDISTFNLRRDVSGSDSSINKPYMGIYSDNDSVASTNPGNYTWVRIQGAAGEAGAAGPQGPAGPVGPVGPAGQKGDSFTGHPYTIDLEGDMSTISLDIDRTRLYDASGDYCECVAHAYYGDENVRLDKSHVSVILPDEYKYLGDEIVLLSNENSKVGRIEKKQSGKDEKGNDVVIKFIPDPTFVFPKKTIYFTIHVDTTILDKDDGNEYKFVRDTIWMVKGLMSTFELEILPQYRAIKLFDDGEYYPKNLSVTVYRIEDAERTVFDFNNSLNKDFKLLYKNLDDSEWLPYPTEGVSTEGVSCLEFKVVKHYGSTDPDTPEEIWDYEDVWVVSDGKSIHYYHADLGSTESMMVLTTGEAVNINENSDDDPIYCAELRNDSGYSIIFEPKFYDGTEELEVVDVNIASNSGEEYYYDGTFVRQLDEIESTDSDGNPITKYKFTVTRVPYGVEMIPMNFDVRAKCITYDESGNSDEDHKNDIVSFNIYISNLSNTYSLMPSVSSYNTSTGKTGDTIGCSVFKNNINIPISELDQNALELKYAVYDDETESIETLMTYTEPLIYGDDDDIIEDEFGAKDVAIEFILYYRKKEIARATVPLIKDGIDGRDGDTWQYIFSRSPMYPFENTGISNPHNWTDNDPTNNENELLGDNGVMVDNAELNWYDDHKGVDSTYRYEYQAYRKWDKDRKCWGQYGNPTLYSNYSESGSGYSVLLSNPVAVIPVGDDDWSTNESLSIQADSTLVYLYSNTSDMSSDKNVIIELPQNDEVINRHFKLSKDDDGVNKITFNPVGDDGVAFNFGSNSQYKLPITLIYSLGEDADNDGTIDNFSTTINWTLSPMKGLEDIEVFVDKRVVNTSVANHYLKVGYYLISSNGGKRFVENHSDEKNTKGFQIILTDDIENLSTDYIVNDWQKAEYSFAYDNEENRNCYVVLVDYTDPESPVAIDYVNVTAVSDGNEGKSAMHLELTQDYIALPSDGSDDSRIHPDYDTNTYPICSRMMLYNGDDLVIDYANISYSFKINETDISSIKLENDGSFNIPKDVIDGVGKGDTNIECIATYKGVSYHKTLFIDLDESPYELDVNKNVLKRNPNGDNKITDENIIVRVKSWIKGKWVYIDDGTVIATTPNGKENIRIELAQNSERVLVLDGSNLAANPNDKEVRISYYRDENCEKELSYETLGIITEGKNGEDGKSAMHLELTQDYIALPSFTEKGVTKVHPEYNETIESKMLLYDGHELATDGDIEYMFDTEGITLTKDGSGKNDGGFIINKDIISGDMNIKCIAKYNGVEFYKTLLIDLEETPYEMEISKYILTRDANNGSILDENITVKVKYWMNGSWHYTQDGTVIAFNPKTGNSTAFETVENSFEYVLDIKDSYLGEDNNNDTEVKISYYYDYNGDGTDDELSYETLGIIKNGSDGKAPTCIATTILGYSLDENLDVESENGWKASLDELGDINIGDKIYIRNQYTWKESGVEGYKYTYGKSVTLAGTQGPEGKSRVLFYRGSFEHDELTGKKPTLSDTFEGELTNVRCDYYIDASGNAWMRKGTKEKSKGYADPTHLSSELYYDFIENWEQSTKVGFLQAGAITADMINTGSLVADDGFITNLTASEVIAENLKVNAANITGTLKVGNGIIIEEGAITADMIDASTLKVNAANITGKLTIGSSGSNEDGVTIDGVISGTLIEEGSITTEHFKVGTINAKIIESETITGDLIKAGSITAEQIEAGSITADRIDADNLTVLKLDTQKTYWGSDTLTKSQIRIQGNEILVTEDLSPKPVMKISGSNIPDDFAETSTPKPISTIFENKGEFEVKNSLNTQLFDNNNEPIRIDLVDITGLIPNLKNEIYTKTRLYVDNFTDYNDPNLDISTKYSIGCTIKIKNHSKLPNPTTKASPNNSQTNTSTSVPGFDIGQQDFTTTTGDSAVGSFSMGIRCVVYDKNDNSKIIATSKYKRTPSASIDFRDGAFFNSINNIGSSRTVNIPFDTLFLNKFKDSSKYTIKLVLEISEILLYNYDQITISYEFANTSVNFYAQSLIGNMPNVNIYKDTFRYFVDDYNYLNIDDEGYFTYYGPGKIDGFGVNKEDGVWFFVGGCYFKLSDLSTSMQNASKRYKDLDERYNTVDGKVNETENGMLEVKNNLFGEGGTSIKPTAGSLMADVYGVGGTSIKPTAGGVMADIYGVDGNSGIKHVANSAQSLATDAFNNANAAQSTADKATTTAGAAQRDATAANESAAAAHERLDTAEINITTLDNKAIKKTVTTDLTLNSNSEPIYTVYVQPGHSHKTLAITYNTGNDKYAWVVGTVMPYSPGYVNITSTVLSGLSDDTKVYITNFKTGTIVYKPKGLDLMPVTKNINGSNVTTYSNTFEITVSQLKEGVIIPFETFDLSNNDGSYNVANIKFMLK